MTGFERSTVSPSSSSMIRSTPWVDGCWGPRLRIIVSSSPKRASSAPGSRTALSGSRSTPPCSISSSTALVELARPSSCAPSSVSASMRRSKSS